MGSFFEEFLECSITINSGKSDHHIIQQPRETSGLVRRQQNHEKLESGKHDDPNNRNDHVHQNNYIEEGTREDDDDGWKVVRVAWVWQEIR